MPRFQVGDIVEYPGCYTGVITSEKDNGCIRILTYPNCPAYVGREYSQVFSWHNLFLYKPILTKEEKFAISKNRVESRHLRNKKV